VQDAWLRLERGRNGLGADEVRVSLFTDMFPADAAPPVATHQISLADFASGEMTRDVMLQFMRDPTALDPGLSITVDAQTIGEHLYTRFISGAVLPAFEALEAAAAGVRVWIEILEPEPAPPDTTRRLSDLPWEALAKPDATGAGIADFLAVRPDWTIVRALRNPLVQPTADRSLRVLVLTGDDVLVKQAGQRPAVRADEDAALVEQAFQASDWSAHVEVVLPPAKLEGLRTALHALQAHVLHFIGHGGTSANDRHALIFRSGPAAALVWDVNDVVQDLREQKAVPRLAVVNACYEAGALDQSTSLARAFLRSGAAAAIGMQARVRADYALSFTRGFYAAIAAGDAPDVALRKGRVAIRVGGGARLLDRDWILPVLTLALPPDQVLPKAEYVDIVKNCGVRRDLRDQGPFIDRHEQRRGVLAGLVPWTDQHGPVHGVLVRGLDQAGKSWFVKRCLAELAQAGAIVRYCDLTGGQGDASSREVIARLRDGWTTTLRSFAYEPLPAAPFAEYDAVRAALQPIVDASGDTGLTAAQITRLFEKFRQGLEALAKTERVVIVLDQFSRSQRAFPFTEFGTYLYPQLIEPILQGKLGNVHVVLSLRETEAGQYGLTKPSGEPIEPGLQKLDVPLFKEGDARRLFFEYCGFQWTELESKLFEVLSMRIRNTGQWKPSELDKYRALVGLGRDQR
jgi:hypothetical protein